MKFCASTSQIKISEWYIRLKDGTLRCLIINIAPFLLDSCKNASSAKYMLGSHKQLQEKLTPLLLTNF